MAVSRYILLFGWYNRRTRAGRPFAAPFLDSLPQPQLQHRIVETPTGCLSLASLQLPWREIMLRGIVDAVCGKKRSACNT